MRPYEQVKSHALRRFADSEMFSPGEWVADRILHLLDHGHNVDSVVAWMEERHALEVRHGNVREAEAVQAALDYMRGEEKATNE